MPLRDPKNKEKITFFLDLSKNIKWIGKTNPNVSQKLTNAK